VTLASIGVRSISERTVSYSGGFLFLVFALHGLWQGGSGLHNA
jgi:putative Ca2+/H+ antiporter (TMEM165/GDT1 family)